MKKVFLLLLHTPFFLLAQKKDTLTKFQVAFGIENNFFQIPNFDGKWSAINPNFTEPNQSDTAFHTYIGKNYGSNARLNFSFQINQMIKESKLSFTPRLNLSFGEGLRASQNWNKNISYRYDTLTSSNTGSEFYLDSTVFYENHFSYYSKSLTCKLALNFDYELSKRFIFYSGIEFGFAYNFSSTQENNTFSYSNKQYFENKFNISSNETISSQNTTYDNKSTMYYPIKVNQLILGVPVGVKFRLSKKENFMNHFLISYEYNFNQSYFKIRSKIQNNSGLIKFQQFQHSHLFRLIYEI